MDCVVGWAVEGACRMADQTGVHVCPGGPIGSVKSARPSKKVLAGLHPWQSPEHDSRPEPKGT